MIGLVNRGALAGTTQIATDEVMNSTSGGRRKGGGGGEGRGGWAKEVQNISYLLRSGQTEGVYDTILNLEYRYGQPMWDYMICRADDISYAGCTPAPDPLGILPGVHCVIEPM